MPESPLRQSVVDGWHAFTGPLEGVAITSMYVDIIGLVTTAYGNLIDGSQSGSKTPWTPALALPWRWPDGGLADSAQVIADWKNLKANELALRRRSVAHQATYTTVRLTVAACEQIALDKLQSNARFVAANYFPDFGTFPADAQLAIMSLAWAAGPGWPAKFPRCRAAILKRDWRTAVQEGVLSTIAADGKTPNPGVIPRNRAQRLCFANAYGVEFAGLDPEPLHWPNTPGGCAPLYK